MNPRPTREGIAAYYPDEYWPCPPSAPTEVSDPGTREALRIILHDYPGGSVLDVGCGTGRQLALMRRHGLDASGIEPAEHACRVAREHLGLNVRCAALADADLPAASFDAVTLFDVLEHLHDPVGDLRRVHRLLKPGGAVFVRAPNIASLQARLLGRWWYGLDAPRHLFHFSPPSLARVLAAAGFTAVRARAVPDGAGRPMFECSVLYWLRGLSLARRDTAMPQTPPASQAAPGDILDGHVYPGVPSRAKRAFRWFSRNLLYTPLAVENWTGRSISLLAVGRKPVGGAEPPGE